MFLRDLNDTQQKLFLGLARELIEADEKISDQEAQLIENLCDEMNQQELISKPDDKVIKDYFPEKTAQVAVMLELIGLSACDGVFDEREDAIIKRIQSIFEMPDEAINAYKEWVKKLYNVYGEGAQFFTPA